MKKTLFVTLAVVLMAAAGCNRAWPSCFCRNHDDAEYAMSDACGNEVSGNDCGTYGTYYGSASPTIEYVRPTPPTPTPEQPLPGPATRSSNSNSG